MLAQQANSILQVAHAEIERKFLVASLSDIWESGIEPHTVSGTAITQGYLVFRHRRTLRIRITSDQAFLTFKGPREGATRIELEEPVSLELGLHLLSLAEPHTVSKIRYPVVADDRIWVVDRFLDRNDGLLVAEIELKTEQEPLSIPSWCGPEVTNDERYYNENLAQFPYTEWT